MVVKKKIFAVTEDAKVEQLDELMDSVEDDFDYAISGIEKLQRSGNMSAAMEQAQRLSNALQSVISEISNEI